jgi:RNA polymerase sigma-70 factor (ECF subfamily)
MENHGELYHIDRVKGGNRESFSWLVDRYKDMVYTICLRMLDVEADAEEAAQDVFLKAFRSIGTFQQMSKFSTWLYRIAYNHSISVIRRKLKMIDLVDELPDNKESDGAMDGLERLTIEERKKHLQLAIEALPETDAVIITLFYYEEMSLEEIADVTGLSSGNIRIRLHRSRKKLYRLITDQLKSEISSIL